MLCSKVLGVFLHIMSPPICLHASYGRCMVSSKVFAKLCFFSCNCLHVHLFAFMDSSKLTFTYT
jgi:hypothetical protein